ncbi:MAG TPA: trehalose-phosphatase [Caulobacteraceae bacterium]|nr:trehalose-phosphatase [Caulobacteraceae bacterium]
MIAPRRDWALFLDIDGTLLEIAPRPDAVRVPGGLTKTLTRASRWLGGALALASGRTLAEIDHLMAPLRPPCLAEHGAMVRFPNGAIAVAGADRVVPAPWRLELRMATREWAGVLVEEKTHGVAVHFRLAPEREAEVRDLVTAAVARDPVNFEVLPARMAFEIRHRGLTKALAVNSLMPLSPFAGRTPVFIGDDVTDEDGFRAAKAMGGLGLNVKEAFDGEPAKVRRWLESFASKPPR